MAKRRAEDVLLHDSPSKRRYRSLCAVDMQMQSMAPTAAVSLSPPSLLALLGSRCRKRPRYFEEPENEKGVYCTDTHCDARKHAGHVLTLQTSGSFQDRRGSSTLTSHKKRPREDSTGSEALVTNANEEADADTDAEDCAYNTFQYWRVPLPEVDLSLLEDDNGHSQTKDKSKEKDSSSEAMET